MHTAGMYPDPEIYAAERRQDRERIALENRVTELELSMGQLIKILEAQGIRIFDE